MNANLTAQTAAIIRSHDTTALNVFGTRVTVLGGGNETAGAFSLARVICPPGAGAPPHTHVETEHFHVVCGRLTVWLGSETIDLHPGDTIHISSGAPHAFSNRGDVEVEFLSLATPAGHEHFFRDADQLARSGQFNPATAAELCQKHGIQLL